MTLLITGGTGFVLGNLTRYWLATNPSERVIILDSAPWDEAIERFLGPVRDRLTFLQADVLDTASWTSQLDPEDITHIVHGAAICLLRELEHVRAQQLVEVNLIGTVNLLEWARSCPSLHRFIYTSSGAVYGEARPGTPNLPYPENGHADPVELYAITKLAGEQIVRRYGELFDLPVASVRFSTVYGPMDRETTSRAVKIIPYQLAHLALAGQIITVNSLEAGGDWIHVSDIAAALTTLLQAAGLQYPVYNIASGQFVTVGELLEIIKGVIPSLKFTVVPPAEADVIHDPKRRLAQWGAYDISRLRAEFGWTPQPISVALPSYLRWLQTESPLSTRHSK